MDNISCGRDTALTGVTSQMSQNTETTATTERDVESRESEPPKSKHVNPSANQFYATIDHTFQNGQIEEKQVVSAETVGKELVEHTSSNELVPVQNPITAGVNETDEEQRGSQKEGSSTNGDMKSVHFEDEQQATEQPVENTARSDTSASYSISNTPTGEQEVS